MFLTRGCDMLELLPLTLVARKKGAGVTEAKHALIAYLTQAGIDFQIDDHPHTLDGLPEGMAAARVDLSTVKKGLLVSLGGDGSFLRLINQASQYQLPMVGINLGRVGFLTDLSMDDLSRLARLLKGDYIADKRGLLEVSVVTDDGDQVMGIALNDIMIASEKPGKNLDFTVSLGDHHMFRHHADGFLVATSTGSTAYTLSAGGPIIHPSLDVHLLTPICSHRLTTRPIVVAPDTVVTIELGSLVNRSAAVCADGTSVCSLPPEGKITVKQSRKKLTLLHPKDYDFFTTAQAKLHWEYQ